MKSNIYRNYGIDLLRIVSMYMIVALHILIKGGVVGQSDSEATNWINFILYSIVICCVNCYGIISGFVGYKDNSGGISYKFSNYINLWLSVVFWNILILCILKITGLSDISNKFFIEALMPVTRNQYWYFTAYTGVFILCPFINRMIASVSEDESKKILRGIGCLSCYITIAQNYGGDPFEMREGYSVVWLSILYVIGALIKKNEWHKKVQQHRKNCVSLVVICITINVFWKYAFGWLTMRVLGTLWADRLFVSYVSPTALTLAFLLVCFFSNLHLNEVGKKMVAFFVPATFGVYLIHVQPIVAHNFIKDRFTWIAHFGFLESPIIVLGISFAILIICLLAEKVRLLMWEILRIGKFTFAIENRIKTQTLSRK